MGSRERFWLRNGKKALRLGLFFQAPHMTVAVPTLRKIAKGGATSRTSEMKRNSLTRDVPTHKNVRLDVILAPNVATFRG
jgi:hypothetical protein